MAHRSLHLNVSTLLKGKRYPLELEEVVLLHVQIGNSEMRVWFGVLNLAIDKVVRTFFVNRHVCCILFSVQNLTLRNSRRHYVSALGHENN